MGQPLHPDLDRVRAALRREPQAMEWLTQRLAIVPRIVACLARPRSLSLDDQKDIAQDVVLVALARLHAYHGLAPFEAWLHEICVRSIYSHLRRQRRRSTDPLEREPEDAASGPAAEAAAQEQAGVVRRAIDAIGGIEAEILRQRFLQGLELSDMAARQGIPLATMRTRYYRALQKLAQRLPPPDGTEDAR